MRTFRVFFTLFILTSFAHSADYDEGLADSLKIEANHNINRLKSYKSEVANNKIFENEREKGLGEFFEDQEKWDLIRERGLRDYLKQKRFGSSTEESLEYKQYLKEKAIADRQYEQSMKTHVKTRDRILRSQPTQVIAELEWDELQLGLKRPRYESDKRRRNKWITIGGAKSGSTVTGSGGEPQNNIPQVSDFPPAPEFPAAPAPYEGFEEIPQPPIYDGSSIPYDPTFGGDLSIPPPPPPPPDYDF